MNIICWPSRPIRNRIEIFFEIGKKKQKSRFDDVYSCSGNCFAVNGLRDQLDDLKRRNQNSHISNEKNIHLQKQVTHSQMKSVKDCKKDKKKSIFFCCCHAFSSSPAGRSKHVAAGWGWGGDKAPQNPDGEQQAAAAAGGQCPRAPGQMLPAGAQQTQPGKGMHQSAGGAGDREEGA